MDRTNPLCASFVVGVMVLFGLPAGYGQYGSFFEGAIPGVNGLGKNAPAHSSNS